MATKTSKRALDALQQAGIADTPSALRALVIYAAQNPGFEFVNYWTGDRRQSLALYRGDYARAAKGWREVRTNARICASVGVTDDDILTACKDGGRAEVTKTNSGEFSVHYTTGQYFPVEYRGAISRLLDRASTLAFERNCAKQAA